MNLSDFFGLVLPSVGYIILAEPLTKGYKHHLFEDEQAAIDKAVELNFEHKNVFFALAGFQQEKVWNPTFKNHDGSVGKWQTRTQTNAGWLRSLFLDLDIDPSAPEDKQGKVYTTREAAIADLDSLVAKLGLPEPLVLDSGGGWHVYWPLDDDATKNDWQPVADKFKAVCISEGLHIDPAVPADAARVLRPLGCHNLKRDYARPVSVFRKGAGPSPLAHLKLVFDNYESAHGLSLPTRTYNPHASKNLPSNLNRESDPVDFGMVAFGCAVIGGQMACGGADTREPLWRACLGIAKIATNPIAAMLSISDKHADFDYDTMVRKAEGWNAGPTTCNYFKNGLECSECATCPNKLTSPVQLGRMKEEAAAPVEKVVNPETGETEEVEIEKPPAPYVRHMDKAAGCVVIAMKCEDKDGNPYYPTVAPNDFYPVRILRNTVAGEISERTLWKFNIPRLKPFTLEIKQDMLGDQKGLQAILNNLGMYASTDQVKAIQLYMSAYLKHLANIRDRERVYTRLGWQFDHDNPDLRTGYVVGQRHFNMDGTIASCNISQGVKNTVNNGLLNRGELPAWTAAMNAHYSDDIYAAHRFFLYCSFAAPLFHITGEKGALVMSSGRSGRGKTTALRAGSSIWGHPDALILNGNPQGATANATENHLGTIHSLPMMWDDTTELDQKAVLRFALNVSQGKGKQRMKGSEHDGRSVSWETMVLSSTNYDTMTQALAGQIATDAHLMRLISVPFDRINDTTNAVIEAEQFKRAIYDNYGLAGVPFMQYVTANYEDVKRRVRLAEDQVLTDFNGKAHERFWMKLIGTVKVAMEIIEQLGLLSFPFKDDYRWMGDHVAEMRAQHEEYKIGPAEELSAFLEERISETLVLSSKATSNLDNVAHMPQRQLTVRHEMDSGVIYIAKTEIGKYCAERNESVKSWEDKLVAAGVLVDRSKQKTLGADTKHAKGQVRCWVVDSSKLATSYIASVQQVAGQ